MRYKKLILVLILVLSFVLRFYNLSENPPGLYIDEVAIGNNAYEILTKGKDEYGEKLPLFFKSFGDYKMPVYIYSVSGAMAIFGKNELAVRFPSAFFGVLTVLVLYFFVRKLLELEKDYSPSRREKLSLLSAFILAVSPWHIQFSRGGFETNLALFIFLFALLLFAVYIEKKKLLILIISSVMFALSIYTYHSYRVISPIIFFALFSFIFYTKPKLRRDIFYAITTFILLCLPVFIFSFSDQGSARFSATSVFSELGGLSLTEKLYMYPLAVVKNYLSYFSFFFLFDVGDRIGRHQIPEFGPVFKWQLPFLIAGVYSLIKMRSKYIAPVLFLLLVIAPIPASLAVPSPHTLRSLLMVIPLTVLIALGFLFILEKSRRIKSLFVLPLLAIAIFEFIFYSHYYYVHYNEVNALDWGGGYKELVLKTEELSGEFDKIIIDENLDFAPIYFSFYSKKIMPQKVDVTWSKPDEWKNKKVLYIRPYYGPGSQNIIYNVYLTPQHSQIFAQFWSL